MLINRQGKLIDTDELKGYDIIFYGASTRNKKVIDELGIQDQVRYVVDSNEKRQGEIVDGYKVYSPCRLEKEKNVLILTVLVRYAEDIIEIIRRHGDHKCSFYLPGDEDLDSITKENRKIIGEVTEKKYIHIFPEDKFVIPFYTMVEECFYIEEHIFIVDCIAKNKQYGILEFCMEQNKKHHNILVMKNFESLKNIIDDDINCDYVFTTQIMENLFDKAEKIILHSVFFSGYALHFIQSMVEKCGRKMVWIAWGGDTFLDADCFAVTEILQKVGNSYSDKASIQRISDNYKIKLRPLHHIIYSYISSLEMGEKKRDIGLKEGLNIMLGHSAEEYCNHEYGFDILYKYHDQNIKIYCPLSYGSSSDIYKNRIVDKGKRLFGDKFIPMFDFMKLEEYHAFLDSIDVVVFPMVRAAAGTTLAYLNSIGRKIYMSKEMIYIYEDFGIRACDIRNIEGQTWEELVEDLDFGVKRKTNDAVVKMWGEILNS